MMAINAWRRSRKRSGWSGSFPTASMKSSRLCICSTRFWLARRPLLSSPRASTRFLSVVLSELAYSEDINVLKLYLIKLERFADFIKDKLNINLFLNVLEVFCCKFNAEIRMRALANQCRLPQQILREDRRRLQSRAIHFADQKAAQPQRDFLKDIKLLPGLVDLLLPGHRPADRDHRVG